MFISNESIATYCLDGIFRLLTSAVELKCIHINHTLLLFRLGSKSRQGKNSRITKILEVIKIPNWLSILKDILWEVYFNFQSNIEITGYLPHIVYKNRRRIYEGVHTSTPLRSFLISDFVFQDTKKIFCKCYQNYLRYLWLKFFIWAEGGSVEPQRGVCSIWSDLVIYEFVYLANL